MSSRLELTLDARLYPRESLEAAASASKGLRVYLGPRERRTLVVLRASSGRDLGRRADEFLNEAWSHRCRQAAIRAAAALTGPALAALAASGFAPARSGHEESLEPAVAAARRAETERLLAEARGMEAGPCRS